MPDTGQSSGRLFGSMLPSRELSSRTNHRSMKMTTDFLVNVIGMPLVHAMKVPLVLARALVMRQSAM